MTFGEQLGNDICKARERLPLTRAEIEARKRRYKLNRFQIAPLTQKEFGARLGVTDKTVKTWEATGIVGRQNQMALAELTGIDIKRLKEANPSKQDLREALEASKSEILSVGPRAQRRS